MTRMRPARAGSGAPPLPDGADGVQAAAAIGRQDRCASAVRALAALAALYICVFPVRAFLFSSDVYVWVKLAWIGAVALGALRPFTGVVVLLAVVPLLPNAPFLFRGIPHGVVHLAVFSQALSLLARLAAGRRACRSDNVTWTAGAWLAVGVASAAASYAGDWVASFSLGDFLRQIHAHLSECVFNTPGPELSNRLLALMTMVTGVLAYVLVSWAAGRRAGADATVYRIVAGAAIPVAVLGFLQSVTGFGLRGMWRDFDPGIVRINSTYSDPNALGTYFAMLTPMMIGLAGAARDGARRAAWLLSAAVALAALVMTAGRMAYLATAVGLVVLALMVIRLGLDRADRWTLLSRWFRPAVFGGVALVLAAVVLGAAVATSLDLRHKDQTSYLRTVLYTLNLRQPLSDTLKGRTLMWQRSARMVAASPVFGLGLGTAYRKSSAFDLEGGPKLPRLSAHNTFLNVASETGIVGLVAFLALLAAVFHSLFAGLTRASPDAARWLRAGLGAGMVAFVFTMISGDRTILAEDVVMFFVVAAIGARLGTPAPSAATLSRRAALAAMVVLALSWPLHARSEMRQVNLARHAWGFYEVEADATGSSFTWTASRAAFHLPAGARAVRLPVRSLAPFPQRVIISLDGRTADEVILRDHNWVDLRYVLPAARGAFRRVDVRVVPAWNPPGEARTLGVMVGDYGWEP